MTGLFGSKKSFNPTANSSAASSPLSSEQLTLHRQRLQHRVTHYQIPEHQRVSLCQLIGQQTLQNSRAMTECNFTATSHSDLSRMARLYDRYFLGGHCFALAKHYGLEFRWSSRMTSNGGKTVRTVHHDRVRNVLRTSYEIVLSAPLLFQTFNDYQRPIRVTGVLCGNRLQAMQRIMEHELIHLVEMLVWDNSCCASARFQNIAQRLFGHTGHKHDLITQQERADRKFNIRVGMQVCFQFEGRLRVGRVNRITRRATVLVEDTSGQMYDDGMRYRKYYIPLAHLAPAAK